MKNDIDVLFSELVAWGLDDVHKDDFFKRMEDLIKSLPIPYGYAIDSVREVAGSYNARASAAIDLTKKIWDRKLAEGEAMFELYTNGKGDSGE